MWQDRLETYLNQQLNEIGWHVEINEFSGHLFSTLHSDNISIKHNNGASIFLPSILTKIKIVPLLFGQIEIEELSVSNVAIQPYFESKTIPFL